LVDIGKHNEPPKDEAHLYAVDRGPLLVYNDGIDVAAKDNRDGRFVLPLSGLAQVNQPATHT